MLVNIVRPLVDHPQSVSVQFSTHAHETVLSLRVAITDFGKVLGRQGRTARSLRTILNAISVKTQHQFRLDIQPEGGSEDDRRRDLSPPMTAVQQMNRATS